MATVETELIPRAFLGTLGDASAALSELARLLRGRSDVTAVVTRCDITGGRRPSVEWYVDAELAEGYDVSWRLLVYVDNVSWTVEADVRRVTASGSDFVVEFESRTIGDQELRGALIAAADQLLQSQSLR